MRMYPEKDNRIINFLCAPYMVSVVGRIATMTSLLLHIEGMVTKLSSPLCRSLSKMEEERGSDAESSALDDQRVSGRDLLNVLFFQCFAFSSIFTCLWNPADKMYPFRRFRNPLSNDS